LSLSYSKVFNFKYKIINSPQYWRRLSAVSHIVIGAVYQQFLISLLAPFISSFSYRCGLKRLTVAEPFEICHKSLKYVGVSIVVHKKFSYIKG